MGTEEKQLKLDRAAQSILSIIVRFGLDNLTPSRLARATQVSRPWVYKYIGGSKKELSHFAVEYFGQLLTKIDPTPMPTNKANFHTDEVRRLQNSLEFAEKHPEVILLYFSHKGSPNILGQAIEKIESQYRKAKAFQIQNTFNVNPKEAEIYADVLSSIKMSLYHKWILGNYKKRNITQKEYLKIIEKLFKKFFS